MERGISPGDARLVRTIVDEVELALKLVAEMEGLTLDRIRPVGLENIERNQAVVFDGAFAFRLTKQTARQLLAREHALPQGAMLGG